MSLIDTPQPLYFDKHKFKQNAPVYVQRLLGEELVNHIDGMEVNKEENTALYNLQCEFNGEQLELYPIYKSYCTDVKQGKLF
ncbi:hypothetical protein IV487_01805 [Enterococcus saccharolyticus]|uniref:hypothetical protein n=1 Tax=Enterococcus saccharolyticus TaxID=41997 RepID=UPI001E2C519C|nr:hypothetical protein [Enterococcus saccharolyticus]MCD5001198.1 hypothetical protein [Enterococcus saccharolyticus]